MFRSILDGLHPHFVGDGKLAKLYPLYEAIDTFLYTPGEVSEGTVHARDKLDLKQLMSTVAVALLPCVLMALWNTGNQANLAIASDGGQAIEGWRTALMTSMGLGFDPNNMVSCFVHGALYFLPVYIVCMAVGGTWEAIFAMIRGHEINEGFLVTGLLFPLTLPPTIPLWQVAVGISFGVVLGKEVFGGTGKNFLNPALTARAFLYFSYPAQISGDKVWRAVDGISSATPLGLAAAGDPMGVTWNEAFFGTMAGSMGETSTLAALIGAFILVASGIGSWRIMTSVTLGAVAFSSVLNSVGSATNPMFAVSPSWHLVIGGFAFGTVFMATDPVSAAMTKTGQWIYGALIGIMTILIRVINPAFPEGIMLAILFGNVFAPLIDFYVVEATIKRRAARHAA